MKKSAIRVKAVILAVISLIGLINSCAWIWITRKTENKKSNIFAWIDLIGVIIISVVSDSNNSVSIGLMCILILLPIAGVCLEIGEYIRCQTLEQSIQEFGIRVNDLTDDMHADISVPEDSKLMVTSKRLYGEKGEAVLRAIAFKEAEKARAEAEKIELDKIRAKAEAANAEAQMIASKQARAEAEKAKAEAERVKAELELQTRKAANETVTSASEQQQKNFALKLDINRCSEQELSQIPGVGIIAAKKAISARDAKGSFRSVDEFIEVAGIRAANIEVVRERVICSTIEPQSVSETKRGRKLDI